MTEEGRSALVRGAEVSRRLYIEPAIFEQEMERIFGDSWVYVGHESQVAQPGDYITTTLEAKPVILSRDEDGGLHLLHNRCIHRGATVCQDARGSASHFRCPHHGWTYRNTGVLTGVPFPQGYGSRIDELRERGLERVAHVESRFGFIFAHAGTPDRSIDEHLEPARPYLERFNASVPGDGVMLAEPPYRYRYDGNWKYQLENAVDGYHPSIVHLSFMKVVGRRTGDQSNPYKSDDGPVRVRSLENGHTVLDLMKARTASQRQADFGDSYLERARMTPGGEDLVAQLREEIGPEAAAAALEGDNDFNLAVFPNLMLIQSQVRVITPVAVDRTVVTGWATVGVTAHPLVNQLRLRMQEVFNGPAGFGSPDDLEMFERWLGLFAEDALYWLPMSRDASVPSAQLNLIFADKRLLGDRIFRIRTGDAHTQDPPSQVTRVIGGVRVEGSDVSALPAWSTLQLTEFRRDTVTQYTARCSHLLRATSIGFEIVRKRVDLSGGSVVLSGLTFLF